MNYPSRELYVFIYMSHRIIKFSEFNEYGTVKKENDYATERNTVIISLSNKQAQ